MSQKVVVLTYTYPFLEIKTFYILKLAKQNRKYEEFGIIFLKVHKVIDKFCFFACLVWKILWNLRYFRNYRVSKKKVLI